MKNTKLILILLVFILSFSCNEKNEGVTPQPVTDYQQELQQLITNHWNTFVDGKEDYPGGYALQILSPVGDYFVSAGDLSDITNQTHFRAGSTTKTFTAAAIMLLHQQGKLNIDHFITDTIPGSNKPYLPVSDEFNIPFKDEISIKLLLQHRAGMFDIINQNIPDTVAQPYAGYRYCSYVEESDPLHTHTIAETAGVVASNQLYNSKPETEFHYSDTGMGLLGLIVERISGKRFDEFISENFLSPLGMENTSFPYEGDDINLPEPFVSSNIYYYGAVFDTTQYNVSKNVAEGNVVTTPMDLANWMKKLYAGKTAVNYENVRFYMMDCLPTYESHQHYGLGTVFTPEFGYGHNGGIGGYFTVARYDPETDISIVMFMNVWDFGLMEKDSMIQLLNMYAFLYEAKEIVAY